MMGKVAANPLAQQAAMGAGQQAVAGMQQQQNQGAQPQAMAKKMVKFMSKKGERSFMAADAPRSYQKKYQKKFMNKDVDPRDFKPKHCKCEGDDFLNSLCKNASRQQKGSGGVNEDALFQLADPNAEYAQNDPQAGQYGFAPQGRVGSIGGGYTKDDFADIPVLGESVRFPTLSEYAARKARNKAKRGRR